ncbi:MAG: biopolymer transporter ExbD [Saprospiraceae bacterium]
MRTKRHMSNEINAGSMADIAFLLLIFFLVTTTISEDKGVLVKLPEWSPELPPPLPINERNVFSVLINAQNQLLVRGNL